MRNTPPQALAPGWPLVAPSMFNLTHAGGGINHKTSVTVAAGLNLYLTLKKDTISKFCTLFHTLPVIINEQLVTRFLNSATAASFFVTVLSNLSVTTFPENPNARQNKQLP